MNAPVGLLRPSASVREATERDAGRIAAYVAQHPRATPFHQPGWLAAVEKACGHRARWLLAERGERIIGILPLSEVRSLLFGRALVSSGFAVDGGIIGDAEAIAPLATAARALAMRLNIPSVELRGGSAPLGWSVDETSYLGFVRDLAPDEDAEMKAIPRKQRAELRKGLANGLEVVVGRTSDLVAEHYRVYAQSVRNLGTPVFPAELFREVIARLDADVLTVRHQGKAVASVLSLYHGGTVHPYWGGGTAAARDLRANDVLYWALMNHARARGCTRFDFGRSKTGTGAAAFKKNWGFAGEPRRYATWSAGAKREVNPLNPKFSLMVATWKRLPQPVADLMGPWISRGLG